MITSLQNKRIKQWRKLHMRKERKKTQTFLIEGLHLVEEALMSDWHVQDIILQKDVQIPFSLNDIPLTFVSEEVFASLAQTESPQGIMAVMNIPKPQQLKGDLLLMVDQVQDPGNLGTMIRTADAAGFSTIILGEGTVDVFNDKVIRATQGSLFHVDIIEANLYEQVDELKAKDIYIVAADLENADSYEDINIKSQIAIIVGNEGAGIQQKILQQADQVVKIPIYGKAESLNVSIAAGILMYQVQRKLAQ